MERLFYMENLTKTKIIATLGPSTSTPEKIRELILAGASMFRLNTSHGKEDDHAKNIKNIREISKELKKYIPILVDLQGPKIRVGNIHQSVEIKEGANVAALSVITKNIPAWALAITRAPLKILEDWVSRMKG